MFVLSFKFGRGGIFNPRNFNQSFYPFLVLHMNSSFTQGGTTSVTRLNAFFTRTPEAKSQCKDHSTML